MLVLRRERAVGAAGLVAIGLLASSAVGCGTGENARREAEMAALVKQVDELKKGQEQANKDVARLAGELKALDAQAAFLVGETKAQAQEREQLKAALQQKDRAPSALRSTVEGTNQKVGARSGPPHGPARRPK